MTTDKLREALADYAHEAWSGWMRYLFSKSSNGIGTSVMIPKWAVVRWRRQMNTPYAALTPDEQESDLKEAGKMLAIFARTPSPAVEGLVDALGKALDCLEWYASSDRYHYGMGDQDESEAEMDEGQRAREAEESCGEALSTYRDSLERGEGE